MTELEYRSHPAISRSELWRIKQSPEKFLYYKNNPPASTPALVFGQALHKAVLEPQTFDNEFVIAPEFNRRTKQGKIDYIEFCELSQDKTVLSIDEMALVEVMTNKLNSDMFVKQLLAGEREKPYFWIDDITGEQCKCRADCVAKIGDVNYIVDLKTCENAETDVFMRKAIDFGYHVQAAMYTEGIRMNVGGDCRFVFVAIEKKEPYSINILEASDLFMQYGYDEYRELLGVYHDCRINNNFYGYLGKFNDINSLGIPAWIAKDYVKN